MYSDRTINVLRDEKSSVVSLIKSYNLYALRQLLVNNALTYEQLIDALKIFYNENSFSLIGEFTMDIIDLVGDYMDIPLIDMFLKNMYVKKDGAPEIIDKVVRYIRTLMDMGGTLWAGGEMVACLPDAIIEEYVDLDSSDMDGLISCMLSSHVNRRIKSKCEDLLQCWEAPIDRIFLTRTLLYHVNRPADPEYFVKLLNYIHKQEDFEWIIFDALKRADLINAGQYKCSFFPEGYVADKKMSAMLMVLECHGFLFLFENMHHQVRKYDTILVYHLATSGTESHIRKAYANLRVAVITAPIVEEKYFEEHKTKIYRLAKNLLVALEQDDETQQCITQQ